MTENIGRLMLSVINVLIFISKTYGKCSKISNSFLLLFSNKTMVFARLEVAKSLSK